MTLEAKPIYCVWLVEMGTVLQIQVQMTKMMTSLWRRINVRDKFGTHRQVLDEFTIRDAAFTSDYLELLLVTQNDFTFSKHIFCR